MDDSKEGRHFNQVTNDFSLVGLCGASRGLLARGPEEHKAETLSSQETDDFNDLGIFYIPQQISPVASRRYNKG